MKKGKHRKITYGERKTIIELKHTPEWSQKFNENKKKAMQLSKLWNELAAGVAEDLTGEIVKNEYNYLLGQYRTQLTKAKVSGSGAPTWRFFDLMHSTLHKDPSINPAILVNTSAQPIINNQASEKVEKPVVISEQNVSETTKNCEKQKKMSISKMFEQVCKSMDSKNDVLKNAINHIIEGNNCVISSEDTERIKIKQEVEELKNSVNEVKEVVKNLNTKLDEIIRLFK